MSWREELKFLFIILLGLAAVILIPVARAKYIRSSCIQLCGGETHVVRVTIDYPWVCECRR